MVYGIMAGKDVKLSSIVRALKEKITPKKVEDRLSRMLYRKNWGHTPENDCKISLLITLYPLHHLA